MIDYLVFLSLAFNVAILGWLIFLHLKYRLLYKKAEILFSESSGVTIAKLIEKYLRNVKEVEDHCFEIDKKIKITNRVAEAGLHKSGFIRYNPFGDVGGNQSFSLCLLDSKNNGFVISSIHSREGTRVYSKTVTSGEGDYNLSEEESKALGIAKK